MHDMTARYPNVILDGADAARAHLCGTGLTIWEVAWLNEVYEGDLDAIARNLLIERSLLDEALDFAREHPDEVSRALAHHHSYTFERLQAELPDIQVFPPLTDETDEQS